MSWLDWFRHQLRRPVLKELPLAVRMYRSDEGQHVVKLYRQVDGREELITDLEPLLTFGYWEQHETERGPVVYTLSDRDQETFLALRSINPTIKNGALLFDFAPTFLNYLRAKDRLEESPASKKLQVRDEALKPSARIDFDPQRGLVVETGYEEGDTGELLPAKDLQETTDGRHVLVGDTFYRLPEQLSEKAQQWLREPYHEVPIEGIPEFILRDLVLLRNEFAAVLTDSAQQIQIIEEPFAPIVSVSGEQPGWLEFNVGYEVADLTLAQQLLGTASAGGYVRLDDHSWLKLDSGALRKVERGMAALGAEPTETGYVVPAARFASLEEFIESIGGRKEADRAYEAFLDQLTGFQADEKFRLSSQAEQDLARLGFHIRPYQRAGVHWLDWLFHNHLHGVLADDMGLGKTLQAICVVRRAYESSLSRQHSLVVAPKSVLHHWEREFQRFFPQIRIYRYHGPGRRRALLRALEPIVFLTTYATASNDQRYLVKVPFLYIILDEATYIKNPSARRTQSIKALNGAHRLALTGTPVENRPQELWSLYDFLLRGHLGKYRTFQRIFEERIAAGDEQASERLGERIRPFLLRRLKGEVAKDLPPKIEMKEWCELTEEQRRLYGGLQGTVKALRDALRKGEQVSYPTSILPVLTKLKQICDHPALVTDQKIPLRGRSEKFDWILHKIDEILRNGEQVVLFSHFLGMLDLFEEAARQKRNAYIRIDGSTSNRQALIDRFNMRGASIALCSIKAAGHGINMTAANHVIHADRWWNPAVEDQATDRVHRIGQEKTVYVYHILVENTLEERINNLLEGKREMTRQIVDAATKGYRAWTREELIELLQPLEELEAPRDYRPRGRIAPAGEKPVVKEWLRESGSRVREMPERRQDDGTGVTEVRRMPVEAMPTAVRLESVLEIRNRLKENPQSRAVIDELVAYLADSDANIRWLAGSALALSGGEQVLAALRAFLAQDLSPEARQEAESVLRRIGGTTN